MSGSLLAILLCTRAVARIGDPGQPAPLSSCRLDSRRSALACEAMCAEVCCVPGSFTNPLLIRPGACQQADHFFHDFAHLRKVSGPISSTSQPVVELRDREAQVSEESHRASFAFAYGCLALCAGRGFVKNSSAPSSACTEKPDLCLSDARHKELALRTVSPFSALVPWSRSVSHSACALISLERLTRSLVFSVPGLTERSRG